MIGERLGGWRVLAKLGRGGMGAVYLAEDEAGARAALKVLAGSLAVEPDALRRFGNEVELLGRLEHPGIVGALTGLQREGERAFYAMEYVRGPNLAQLLGEVGRLDPARAVELTLEILDALQAAHDAGIVHRDLKGANVLVDAEGHAKVCDFGLARAVDLTRLTITGHVVGTPAYLAPEQARGEEGVPASDLYAVGVVLYELLTGQLPFQAERPLVLLNMHLNQAPEPPSAQRPELPAALDAAILRALAKDPTERFASAADMAHALRELDAGSHEPQRAELLTTAIRAFIARETQELAVATAPTQQVAAPPSQGAPAPPASPRRRLGWLAWIALAALAALGLRYALDLGDDPAKASLPPAPAVEEAPRARVVLHGNEPALEDVEILEVAEGQVRVRLTNGEARTLRRVDVREVLYR